MKLLSRNQLISGIATAVFSVLVLLTNPLVQANECSHSAKEYSSFEQHPFCYLKQYPWLGLIMDEVNYGPITVSHVHVNQGSKLAIVKPGEVLHGDLRYYIDSSDQEAFHRHHLVVGIAGVGAQDCIAHNWGVFNSNGKGKFSLVAPLEPGLYEVRFFYQEASTCEGARKIWNNNPESQPSSFATIGAVLVVPPEQAG